MVRPWEYRRGSSPDAFADLADDSVALVLTDPPYGMAYRSSRTTDRLTNRAIDNDAGFDPEFHDSWLQEAYRVARNGGALYAFIDDQHLGDLRQRVSRAGWHLKRTLVWLKDAWTVGDLAGDYGHQTEFVVYAHKGRHILAGGRESNVLRFPRVPPARLRHTTEKPVPLLSYLVRKSSAEGDLVLDPFAGVASVGEAALGAARRYVGVECDSRWWPVAESRMTEADSVLSLAIGAA